MDNESTKYTREDDSNEDREVEELVVQYIDRINRGEILSPKKILADHPRIGKEVLSHLQGFIDLGAEFEGTTSPRTLGDYTLSQQIGRGGMGVVYDAWETSMDRRVALKVLPAGIAADDKAFNRFMREARTAGKLSHPNVVPVYGVGIKDHTPYFAMEFVEGETLMQILARLRSRATEGAEGETAKLLSSLVHLLEKDSAAKVSETALPDAKTLAVDRTSRDSSETTSTAGAQVTPVYCYRLATAFASVADGLQHAHSKGVVHRDIKPSNLILDRDGRLRILDFGLAQLEGQESLTTSGDLLGTVQYMSPEQAMARRIPIDHRTDIYSLGATLYEMLTLRPPFEGRNYQDTLSKIVLRDPTPPRRIQPSVPGDLETIVLKCLRKEAGDRYGTAEALAQDLRRFVRGDPIEARRQPGWERLARRAWRVRLKLAAVVFAALFVVAVGLLVLSHWKERERIALEERTHFYDKTLLESVETLQQASEELLAHSHGGLRLPSEFFVTLEALVRELEKAARTFPDRPEAWKQLAEARSLLGQHAASWDALDRSLEADSRFVPALVTRASLLEKRGEEAESKALRDRATSIVGKARVKLGLEGSQAWREGDWDRAANAYAELLNLRGEKVLYFGWELDARLKCASASIYAEDYDQALVQLGAIRALWPELASPAIQLGKVYLFKGDNSRAEQQFGTLFSRTADQNEIRRVALGISETYKSVRNYQRALEWARQAPESARGQSLISSCLRYLGRHDEAIEAARHGLALDPNAKLLRIRLILALQLSGHRREAIAECQRAIQRDPAESEWHRILGQVLGLTGDYEGSLAAFDDAIRLEPNSAMAYLGRFHTLARLERIDEAIVAGKEAQKRGLLAPEAMFALAELYHKKQDFRAAAEQARKAIALDPTDPRPRLLLVNALVSHDTDSAEDAAVQCLEILELDPDAEVTARTHAILGFVRFQQGEFEESARRYREALRLDALPRTELGYARASLGAALGKLRHWDEAIAVTKRAVELEPTNLQWLGSLVKLHLESKRFAQAIPVLEEIVRLGKNNEARELYEELLGKLESVRTEMNAEEALRVEKRLEEARELIERVRRNSKSD